MGTKFVVIAAQRSGSSWLMDLLNKQENSVGFGELFLQKTSRRPPIYSNTMPRFVEWQADLGWLPKRLQTFRYCDRIYASRGSVGYKLMYGQLLKHPELLWYFRSRSVSVAHLTRNALDIAISGEFMRKRGEAHQRVGEQAIEGVTITLDVKRLLARIRQIESRRAAVNWILSATRLRYKAFSYEELTADPAPVMHFLGIRGQSMQSTLVKIIKSREAVVENWVEVSAALAGNGYGRLTKT